jgi:hypothetical protein
MEYKVGIRSPFGTSLMATTYATWDASLKLPGERLNHNGMMELNGVVYSNEQILRIFKFPMRSVATASTLCSTHIECHDKTRVVGERH